MEDFSSDFQMVQKIKCDHLEILKVFGHLSKMISFRTNNGPVKHQIELCQNQGT